MLAIQSGRRIDGYHEHHYSEHWNARKKYRREGHAARENRADRIGRELSFGAARQLNAAKQYRNPRHRQIFTVSGTNNDIEKRVGSNRIERRRPPPAFGNLWKKGQIPSAAYNGSQRGGDHHNAHRPRQRQPTKMN